MSTNPTRADYMAKKVTHEQFYGAVVETAGIYLQADHSLVGRAREALAAGDKDLNTIPLVTWDLEVAIRQGAITRALKEHGDFFSLAGGVCVMKQAVLNAV